MSDDGDPDLRFLVGCFTIILAIVGVALSGKSCMDSANTHQQNMLRIERDCPAVDARTAEKTP